MFITITAAAACALAGAIGACSRSPNAGSGASAGASNSAERRIAVISPAVAVMLRDLGLESEIVGRHGYDLALDPGLPVVGDLSGVDYETLIGVRPTHVYTEFHGSGVPERLSALAAERGWALEDFRLRTLDDIAQTIDDLHLDLIGLPERSVMDFDPGASLLDQRLPSERLASAWRDRGPAVRGAGRVMLIAADSPVMILGPGSFHHEILTRIGATAARTEGDAWQALDAEDVLHIAPDSIVVLIPHPAPDDPDARFVETDRPGLDELRPVLGRIADLPIPAIESGRVAAIHDPLALLPSSSLAAVANEIAAVLEEWTEQRPVDEVGKGAVGASAPVPGGGAPARLDP